MERGEEVKIFYVIKTYISLIVFIILLWNREKMLINPIGVIWIMSSERLLVASDKWYFIISSPLVIATFPIHVN